MDSFDFKLTIESGMNLVRAVGQPILAKRVKFILGLKLGDLSGDGGGVLVQAHECLLILRARRTTTESIFFGNILFTQRPYARHCRPAGVKGHITRKTIASEPGISRGWPPSCRLVLGAAVHIGKVRSRSR